MSLLDDITDGLAELDPQRRERGMAAGRWSSTPISRRSPVNLDVLALTDRRTGALAVLMFWAARIRRERRLPRIRMHTLRTEAALIAQFWSWATDQEWGQEMVTELQALADTIHEVRFGVAVRPCPVCGEPVRVDRFVAEHRACLDSGVLPS